MARPRLISDEQILDATREAVNSSGPGVSLEVIASKLGVSQPALLKRFGSRNKLMVAALRPSMNPAYRAKLEAGPDERPLNEQLFEVFGWLSDWYEENAPRIAALRESGIPMCDVFSRDEEPPPLRVTRVVGEWLDRCKRLGLVTHDFDTETLAFSMISTVSSRAHMRHIFQDYVPKTSQRAFLNSVNTFFVRALTPALTHLRRAPAAMRAAHMTRLSRSSRRTK